MSHIAASILLIMSSLISTHAVAMSDKELENITLQRLNGDRTGACFAVGMIDKHEIFRATACADSDSEKRVDAQSAFEIGSISKTMAGTLLARLILEGKASLDDPLSDYLPDNAQVPTFEGNAILLRHIVTHTSGLPAFPPGITGMNPIDPYADIGKQQLLAALEQTRLSEVPGSRIEYSNFAAMLLSWAISERAGTDFSTLVETQLFKPLGMQGAFTQTPPDAVRIAQGHLPTGIETAPWTFQPELAGVGGVRATLEDMITYARAQLGQATGNNDSVLAKAIALTHQPVATAPDTFGTNAGNSIFWMKTLVGKRILLAHGGGTGGFSSYMAFDIERQHAVIVLSDTALTSLGGLGNFAQHLLEPDLALEAPRTVRLPPTELLEDLAGHYQLTEVDMDMELRVENNALVIQAEGQPAFRMGFDSNGDFYPLTFDALLVPSRRADGTMSFVWRQGGGQFLATRKDSPQIPRVKQSPEQLRQYEGEYPLQPEFILSIREKAGALHAQATGQASFEIQASGKDVFEALPYGIEVHFERGDDGEVTGLRLLQNGKEMHATRQAADR